MTHSRPNPPAKASRKPNLDPWYDIKRDMLMHVLENRKDQSVKEQPATPLRLDIEVEYMKRAKDSLKRSTDQGKPFLHFNYSVVHLPTPPRAEFEDKSGHEEWADELLQTGTDFGTLLNYLTSRGIDDNTASGPQFGGVS